MLADIPDVLLQAGALAAVVTAVAAAIAAVKQVLPGLLRPARWLWRVTVSTPLGTWQREQIDAVVAPLAAELTTTTDTLLGHMGAEDHHRAQALVQAEQDREEQEAWRTEVREDIGQVRSDIGTLHRRVDSTMTALAAGKPEQRTGT